MPSELDEIRKHYEAGQAADLRGTMLLLAEIDRLKASSPVVPPRNAWEALCLCGVAMGGHHFAHGEVVAIRADGSRVDCSGFRPQPTPEGSGAAVLEDDETARVALAAFTKEYTRDPNRRGERLNLDSMRAAIRAINKLRGTP